jgi:predicted secreted Zn-dependent protease
MLRFPYLKFCCLSLIVYTQAVTAAPKIKINTDYYDISGHDSASIRDSIKQNGPVGENGKKYHAYTRWKVDWGYRWIESNSSCRLTGLDVSIDITYLLPQLENKTELSESMQQNWDQYYDALFKHEQQHKDFGIQAAHELEKTLLGIQPQNCVSLEHQLTDAAENVLDKYHRMEREFDINTNHGAKQGITLP